MVTGYEALERHRGIRRPRRKLADESSEPGKKHRSMKQNFIRHTKKKIKNVQSRRQSWQLVRKSSKETGEKRE